MYVSNNTQDTAIQRKALHNKRHNRVYPLNFVPVHSPSLLW